MLRKALPMGGVIHTWRVMLISYVAIPPQTRHNR